MEREFSEYLVWKELTHIRDPTDLSEGKALVGFENLKFKGSGST